MNAAILLLRAAVLAHEVCLLRVLALAYWHHAASLVVSVALLGFGVAGTLLALFPRLKRPETVAVSAALYAVLIPLSVRAAGVVDFNVLEVGWDRTQWLRLLALEAIFFVPFLFAACGIAVALALRSTAAGGIYAANLIGSGLGALAAPLLMYLGPPSVGLAVVAVAAALAAVPVLRGGWRGLGAAAALVALGLGGADLEMSPFKAWPATPNKRHVRTVHGPMGRVDRAEVDTLHHAPGLSLHAPAHPERQLALFVDGHLVGVRNLADPAYLPWTVDALPFVLAEPQRVLQLGLGPALPRVTDRVDPNAQLLAMAGEPGTVAEPRAFLARTGARFDLIFHHVPELHAAAETPLLTEEGLRAALEHGEVALSCGLATPPRAGLKLLQTAERVTEHVIAVRSADRLCVWLRHAAPTGADRAQVIAFCRERGFDPVRPMAWRFDEPYHETRTPLLPAGDDYPYDVRPATEARPYFFKFFKWSRLGDLFDVEQTSFVEWPYVALLVAFLQVTLLSVLLMAGPLWLSGAARAPALLFLALGLGFMFLEMAFLQRAMVRVGSPVHAAAAVLGGFLLGSGCGSLLGERLGRPLRRAALLVVVLAPLGYWLLPRSAPAAALVCAAVACPMGIPFPAALSRLAAPSVPWALAWNGCASVAAAAAAPLLSSTFGIPVTAGAALLLYLAVAAFSRPAAGA
ncbi:MAG: hypothetical protein ACYTED_07445 [Planctomycetota bacterium]